MKFAFLIHHLSEETRSLLRLHGGGLLRRHGGSNVLDFCSHLHRTVEAFQRSGLENEPAGVEAVDEWKGLVSRTGARAEGRLYEIPMTGQEIHDDPPRALALMEQAVEEAAAWGARLVGLGSMTGIVGGHGTYLAERGSLPVTTGDSLTVYAALRTVDEACAAGGIDLERQTVAVLGVPDGIATAAATLLAPRCRHLLLVARRPSPDATRLAKTLDAELLLEIPAALARARVIVSAASQGACLDPRQLLPGSLFVDAAPVPGGRGFPSHRGDVLMVTGGLATVPDTMPRDAAFLGFSQGTVPSTLAETMTLALESRAERFSLGPEVDLEKVREIGDLAASHGFAFARLFSLGLPVEASQLASFRKAVRRAGKEVAPAVNRNGNGKHEPPHRQPPRDELPAVGRLAERAAERWARYVNPILGGLTGKGGLVKTFVRAQGAYLFDADGRPYLDLTAGFGTLNLGHNPPAIVTAIAQALQDQAPGSAPATVNPLAAALAERLVEISPPGLDVVCLRNSGAEAVEAALKLARAATGRADFLFCEHSGHGPPLGVPLTASRFVPFGDLETLETALSERRFAAFLVEPIQGEGGMIVPPAGYLAEAGRLCRQTGTLLLVDEGQTGLGRTGELFAVERAGVEPDALCLGESLGGGVVPLGALLTRRDLWMQAQGILQAVAPPGSVACAAGLAAVRALEDEALLTNVRARSRQLGDGLTELVGDYPMLQTVRGQGLMLGLEFQPLPARMVQHFKGLNGTAASSASDLEGLVDSLPGLYVRHILLHVHGIYIQMTRGNPRVLRVQPPLSLTEADAAHFLRALEEVCSELAFLNDVAEQVLTRSGGVHGAFTGRAASADSSG
jgi:putrescine aminotransferase